MEQHPICVEKAHTHTQHAFLFFAKSFSLIEQHHRRIKQVERSKHFREEQQSFYILPVFILCQFGTKLCEQRSFNDLLLVQTTASQIHI